MFQDFLYLRSGAGAAQRWHTQSLERAVSASGSINVSIVLHRGNYDENGDGELSMDEFRHLSKSVWTPCLVRVHARACVCVCVSNEWLVACCWVLLHLA